MKALFLLCVASVAGFDIPVIGVLSQPFFGSNKKYIPENPSPYMKKAASYIKPGVARFVESGGSIAVPIFFDDSIENIDRLLDRLDGVLFTGGPLVTNSTVPSTFMDTARHIYDRAMSDDLPLFGICQGMQVISRFASRKHNVLQNLPLSYTFTSLDFSPATTMGKVMPTKVRDTFKNKPTATNNHHWSVTVERFEDLIAPRGEFVLSAKDVDENGTPIVGVMESVSGHIIATQFHPEVDPAAFTKLAEHDDDVSDALKWLTSHFTQQAQQAKVRFDREAVPLSGGFLRSPRPQRRERVPWTEEELAKLSFNRVDGPNWEGFSHTSPRTGYLDEYVAFPRQRPATDVDEGGSSGGDVWFEDAFEGGSEYSRERF